MKSGACRPEDTKQIVFTVNGPGEIMGWLHPLCHCLRQHYPRIAIHVCILPCIFSSGTEKSVIEELGCVDSVLSTPESMALILRGKRPQALARRGQTLVFHLGGEIALTHLLGLRLRAPRYGYVEHRLPLNRLFERVFYNGLSAPPDAQPENMPGELMVDAALLRRAKASRRRADTPAIALFPGSRSYIATKALPYFAVQVDRLSARFPGLEWVVARARFLPMDILRNMPPVAESKQHLVSALRFFEDSSGAWFETEAGNRIRILAGPEAMASADYALTIPGTNTGELASIGMPMVVVLPTYTADELPAPGLVGHLGRIPLLGGWLKQALVGQFLRRHGLLAQPNIRAGRILVPEFSGEGLHDAIEAALAELIAGFGQDATLREALQASMGRPGAALALTAEIARHFGLEREVLRSR